MDQQQIKSGVEGVHGSGFLQSLVTNLDIIHESDVLTTYGLPSVRRNKCRTGIYREGWPVATCNGRTSIVGTNTNWATPRLRAGSAASKIAGHREIRSVLTKLHIPQREQEKHRRRMMFLMTTTTMVQTSPLSSDENQSTSANTAQTMSRQRVVSFDYHDHPDEARPSRSIAASWSSDDETILLQGVQTLDSRPLQMQMSWDEDDDLRRNVREPFRDISNRRASNANNIFRAH